MRPEARALHMNLTACFELRNTHVKLESIVTSVSQ